MGVFQKLGIRNLAIAIINFITWVRQYGFNDGLSIYASLKKRKNGFFKIDAGCFKNLILLRDNFSDKAIFNQVYYERQYFLQQLVATKAKNIIDAGANIGLASIYFSQLYPSAQVIAIEPENDNYDLLKKNTNAYANVTCIKAALWSKEENIAIKNPDSLAASYIVEAGEHAQIKGITIDYLLEMNCWDKIDILKMDIEGAEKEIFSTNVSWL
ncbi:MAG TPA: FkbM family methyltransferase, partial [Chitinophagaceae bacterium]|nr:FkbM family methyltransferase [Chitinophagaceae bacterium]